MEIVGGALFHHSQADLVVASGRGDFQLKTAKESSIQDISNRKVGLKIIVINCSQLCVKNCKLGIRGSHKHGGIC